MKTVVLDAEKLRLPSENAPPDFDGLADVYRWMEWASFGPLLARCRFALLHEISHCRHALVIGDGDGRFTARFLKTNPHVEVDAVDASAAMLRVMRARAGKNSKRLRTLCIDAREWRPDRRAYDLIVTHFFLDCLSTKEVAELAKRVRAAAAPDAIWVVSEFAVPDGWFGRSIAQPLITLLYRAFGWMTGLRVRQLPDYSEALLRSGFNLEKKITRLRGLLVSDLWRIGGAGSVTSKTA